MMVIKKWIKMEGGIVAINPSPEQQACAVLKEYGFERSMPVPIEEICNKLGIQVLQARFKDDNISGMIRRAGNGHAIIYVNRNHSLARQRFTTAHELGHFLLHLKNTDKEGLIERGDIQERYRRDGDHSPEEREANRFAAALLMPDSVIREVGDVYPVDILAQFLAVSPEVLEIRLKNA